MHVQFSSLNDDAKGLRLITSGVSVFVAMYMQLHAVIRYLSLQDISPEEVQKDMMATVGQGQTSKMSTSITCRSIQ